MTDPVAAAAALLGVQLYGARPLAGGDLSQPWRVTLADGREAVAKSGPAPRAEAAMLRAIAAAGVAAPAVLAVSDRVLVIEWLQAGDSPARAWGDLGRALATLHACRGRQYGWPQDYAFGKVPIPNAARLDWPAFWAEHRLRPSLPHLPACLAGRVEALADSLPDRLPVTPPPALLHGDLWGGNILAAGDRICGLIDPACYHGDGEVDIAMLSLFDRPGPAFFDAYGRLEPGHAERLAIYRLWPALVHLRLFGSGCRMMVERQLDRVGA